MIKQLRSLFGFFFVSVIVGSGVGYGQVYLFHVVLILLLLRLGLGGGFDTSIPNSRYISYLFFLLLWYFVGVLWSFKYEYTLIYSVYILLGLFIILITTVWAKSIDRFEMTMKVIGITFFVQFIICFLEIFTPFRLPTSPYSPYASFFNRRQTDFNVFDNVSAALIETVPTGFFGNPNQLAITIVSILPFFLFADNRKLKWIGILSVLTILVFSGSRGAFIALAAGLMCHVILYIKSVKKIVILFLVIFSYLLLSVNIEALKKSENKRIAELAYIGDTLNDYIFGEDVAEGSISYRKMLIDNGLEALWSTGGIGVGGGASRAVQEAHGGIAAELGSMHNFWIEILVEAGVLMFVTFLIWYGSLVYRLFLIYKTAKDRFFKYHAGSLSLAMIIFSVACISASSVIYLLPMWLMFGLGIAIINLHKKMNV